MKITYLAHSCFLIETKDNVSIIIDPYRPGAFGDAIKYKPIDIPADIVLITHEHADHNAVDEVRGSPQIVRKSGEWIVKGIPILGIKTYHDTVEGRERGTNNIYVIESDGIRLAHLGDLGHLLSEKEKKALGDIDVLFTPVGGLFTINPSEAWKNAEFIGPKVVIPMHFKTEAITFQLSPLGEFLKVAQWPVIEKGKETEVVLPDREEVWIMMPSR